MTITNGYATLAEYKSWIAVRGLVGSVSTDASDDVVIESLIEMASRYIDRETGRRFYLGTSDETRYYTPDNSQKVSINEFGSITSVSVDYSGTRTTYTALAATDYDTLPDNAALDGVPFSGLVTTPYSANYFPLIRRGVKVVGKIGFPSIPADIKSACLGIVEGVYASRSGQSSQGKVTVTAAGVVIRPEEIPAWAQKVISHYRDFT